MRAGKAVPCALALGLWVASASAQQQTRWQVTHEEQGITVSTREEAGQAAATFRGEGEVPGSILHVLAIVLDDARAKEWARGADESRVLRKIDARTDLVYSRSRQPWPVEDRDLVMKRTVEVVTPGKAYRVRLVCVPGEKPESDGVVRIRSCETLFFLRQVDDAHTHVEFRVRAEAGGPAWIARLASKSIPLETLLGLRKQVDKTRDRYTAAIAHWREAR